MYTAKGNYQAYFKILFMLIEDILTVDFGLKISYMSNHERFMVL